MADIVRIGPGGREPPTGEPDAHGQAALMLAESMLHALVDAGAFTTEDAVAIIATAQDVKEETGREAGEASETIAALLRLLGEIATSFVTDLQQSNDEPSN